MYHDGLGVEKDLQKAIDYCALAIETAKTNFCIAPIQALCDSLELWKKDLNVERNTATISHNSNATEFNTEIEKLLISVTDQSKSPDERLTLAESIKNELFESPNAVVRIMDKTEKTVVSTQKAEDFMLELSTSGNISSIKILEVNKAASGKVASMNVKYIK